jgi:hypothetical protein
MFDRRAVWLDRVLARLQQRQAGGERLSERGNSKETTWRLYTTNSRFHRFGNAAGYPMYRRGPQ